ncbi:MAG: hypothetical protein ABSG48_05780, partial [Geobacteraceae bacterium]
MQRPNIPFPLKYRRFLPSSPLFTLQGELKRIWSFEPFPLRPAVRTKKPAEAGSAHLSNLYRPQSSSTNIIDIDQPGCRDSGYRAQKSATSFKMLP